jgi:hypothetical protein
MKQINIILTALKFFGRLNYYEGVDKLSFTDWLYKYRISWKTAVAVAKIKYE